MALASTLRRASTAPEQPTRATPDRARTRARGAATGGPGAEPVRQRRGRGSGSRVGGGGRPDGHARGAGADAGAGQAAGDDTDHNDASTGPARAGRRGPGQDDSAVRTGAATQHRSPALPAGHGSVGEWSPGAPAKSATGLRTHNVPAVTESTDESGGPEGPGRAALVSRTSNISTSPFKETP